MFYLSYLRSELLRRKGRTILTLLGLALGVALVIVITSLSHGLDQAQKTALNPLSSIGTDLTVTVSPDSAGGAFANRTVSTDLSTLGKAGQHFSYDTFSSGSQVTFAQSQTKSVKSISGVAKTATGLTLTVTHQEGKVPKISTQITTGGQQINVQGRTNPPTAAEMAKMASCLAKQEKNTSTTTSTTTTASPGGNQSSQSGSLTGQSQGGPGQFGGSAAMRKCMPASMRRFQKTITTQKKTTTKQVKTPKTNIKTSTYTIGGVDTSRTDMGLITSTQVTKGRFLSKKNARQALIANSYASSHKLKVGSTLTIKKVKFRVVGLVQAPLGGQSADVYVPLTQLQTLSGQKNQINVVLVRADKSSAVGAVQKKIEKSFSSAQVASAKDEADQISGSLVTASDLAKSLGLALSIIVIAMAIMLAALLTLSSVAKRVREIGTLRALGWSKWLVIRQVGAESMTQGVIGGVIGVVIGIGATAVINSLDLSLSASSATASTTANRAGFGPAAASAAQTVAKTTNQVALHAPLAGSIILIGFALAVLGGLLAGATGALRAAQLRPADALRQVE
jgi:ABC-type antimicrobial peptide transport system permease subunit